MGPIFTIDDGQSPKVNKFTDEEEYQKQTPVETPGSSDVVTNEYTRPLFKIYGFGVSHMYIDLASVMLMCTLVLISLVSGFKK